MLPPTLTPMLMSTVCPCNGSELAGTAAESVGNAPVVHATTVDRSIAGPPRATDTPAVSVCIGRQIRRPGTCRDRISLPAPPTRPCRSCRRRAAAQIRQIERCTAIADAMGRANHCEETGVGRSADRLAVAEQRPGWRRAASEGTRLRPSGSAGPAADRRRCWCDRQRARSRRRRSGSGERHAKHPPHGSRSGSRPTCSR